MLNWDFFLCKCKPEICCYCWWWWWCCIKIVLQTAFLSFILLPMQHHQNPIAKLTTTTTTTMMMTMDMMIRWWWWWEMDEAEDYEIIAEWHTHTLIKKHGVYVMWWCSTVSVCVYVGLGVCLTMCRCVYMLAVTSLQSILLYRACMLENNFFFC